MTARHGDPLPALSLHLFSVSQSRGCPVGRSIVVPRTGLACSLETRSSSGRKTRTLRHCLPTATTDPSDWMAATAHRQLARPHRARASTGHGHQAERDRPGRGGWSGLSGERGDVETLLPLPFCAAVPLPSFPPSSLPFWRQ